MGETSASEKYGAEDGRWHVQPDDLAAWAQGRLDDGAAWSVEAHLPVCHRCREKVGALVPPERLETGRRRLLAEIDAPLQSLAERVLAGLGVPEHLGRLVVVTPSLRRSWLVAVGIGLALAVGASRLSAGRPESWHGMIPYLALAPVLPLLGVAAAFGPRGDPAFAVVVATPFSSFRLLLLRTLASVGASIVLLALSALLLPQLGWGLAVLIPALALSAVTLALSSVSAPVFAAGIPVAGWLVTLSVGLPIWHGPAPLASPQAQILGVVVALAAGVVVATRRGVFETGPAWATAGGSWPGRVRRAEEPWPSVINPRVRPDSSYQRAAPDDASDGYRIEGGHR